MSGYLISSQQIGENRCRRRLSCRGGINSILPLRVGRPVTGKTPTTLRNLSGIRRRRSGNSATRPLPKPPGLWITRTMWRSPSATTAGAGLEKGEAKYAGYEQRLAALPPITVPTITWKGRITARRIRLPPATVPNLPVNMSTGICRERWAITRRRRIRRRLCRRWWTPIVCNPRLAGGATLRFRQHGLCL